MSSSTHTSLVTQVTSIVFESKGNEPGAKQRYFGAYCLNPPEDDGCPYGPCPNPDVTGIGQQISIYITTGTFAFALVYFPQLVRPMLYNHLAVIYSLMIAALISIVRGELTLNDGVFVLVAVGSPCSIYLWFSTLRSLITRSDFPGQGHRDSREVQLLKLLCMMSMAFEIVIICLLFVPSSRIHFSQPTCNREFGKNLILNLAWALQYVREGLLAVGWIVGSAWFYRWWYKRHGRTLSQAVATTPPQLSLPDPCRDTIGNGDTDLDLDLISWTEGLLKTRYPTLMPPLTIKLVVGVLQMSAFASLMAELTDAFIGILLLVGIWHPYFRRRDSAFTPRRSWMTRSLLTIPIVGLVVPTGIDGSRAVLVAVPMVVGIWRADFGHSQEDSTPSTSRRSTYLRKGLASLLIMSFVPLSFFLMFFDVPILYDLVVLFIVFSTRFPSIWRLPVGPNLPRHAMHILLPVGAVLMVLVASNPMLSAGMQYLMLRPIRREDGFTPMFILKACSVSLWVTSWLGTTTWLHIADRRQRTYHILDAIFSRAHIFKFGLLVFSPNALWIQACILSNPTNSTSMTFGQIFASIVSLATLLSLVDELRRIKKADWVAMLQSEPLPSKTIADPNQALTTRSSILSPLHAASADGHEYDGGDHLPHPIHGQSAGIPGGSDSCQSPSDPLSESRKSHGQSPTM